MSIDKQIEQYETLLGRKLTSRELELVARMRLLDIEKELRKAQAEIKSR